MESRNKREKKAQSNRYTYPPLCVTESTRERSEHAHAHTHTPPPADFRSHSLQSQPARNNMCRLRLMSLVICHFAIICVLTSFLLQFSSA